MSDLEDIVAEAQIAIVESSPNDGGDSLIKAQDRPGSSASTSAGSSLQTVTAFGDSGDMSNIEALNALFSHRYTDEDPDYLKTVEMAEVWSRPPCVEDFFVRRQRDDNRRHGRGGGRGSYHHRGSGDRGWRGRRDDHRGDRNRYGNHGGWGGGDNRGRNPSYERGYNSYREGGSSNSYRSGGRDRSPHR